jgi:hypothetical protein
MKVWAQACPPRRASNRTDGWYIVIGRLADFSANERGRKMKMKTKRNTRSILIIQIHRINHESPVYCASGICIAAYFNLIKSRLNAWGINLLSSVTKAQTLQRWRLKRNTIPKNDNSDGAYVPSWQTIALSFLGSH